jgi:hypothetical protein
MWSLARAPIRILVLNELELLLVRVVGNFDATDLRDRLISLTREQPVSATFKTIIDLRFAQGFLAEEEAAAVRDFRYQMRCQLGQESLADGPHALVSLNVGGIEEIAHTHAELHPDTKMCLTDCVDIAWDTVVAGIEMPKEVRTYFAKP